MEKNFGWWPRNSVVDARVVRAEPLSTYASAIAAVKDHPRSYDGWFYPLLEPVRSTTTEKKPPPEMPTPTYELPVTHRITATEPWMDEEYLNFVIALVGLVDGMRLIPDGWVHFYKAPTAPNKLSDLACDAGEIAEIVFAATTWWKRATMEERRGMFAAVHWYCFSGLYHHEFEEFAAKYTVLDTLDWIHRRKTGGKRGSHAERPFKLAKAYGLEVPSWAVMHNNSCRLSEIRNELIHEAQFGGRPIGFAHLPEKSLTLELGHFLTRLMIAMLCVECSYVQSPVNTRMIHGLGLLKHQLT
jgi:hypothetical protein